tara:strand:+ start:3413 stop:3862 length:450 start_codon:yes stop_codon:yes gene_type:complete
MNQIYRSLDHLTYRLKQKNITPSNKDRQSLNELIKQLNYNEAIDQHRNKFLYRFATWAFAQIFHIRIGDNKVTIDFIIHRVISKMDQIARTDRSMWEQSLAVDLFCMNPKGDSILEHEIFIRNLVEEIIKDNTRPDAISGVRDRSQQEV